MMIHLSTKLGQIAAVSSYSKVDVSVVHYQRVVGLVVILQVYSYFFHVTGVSINTIFSIVASEELATFEPSCALLRKVGSVSIILTTFTCRTCNLLYFLSGVSKVKLVPFLIFRAIQSPETL